MELEPLAPSEPGEVSPEALAAEPIEAIEIAPPGAPELKPVEPSSEEVETTLELHPTEPKERIPVTQALPVIPEPTEPVPKEPPPTAPQPVVPEPSRPLPPVLEPPTARPEPESRAAEPRPELDEGPVEAAPLERTEIEAKPDLAGARPTAVTGTPTRRRPRTIGDLLRTALNVGR
jgi:hypothetical protein